jgi:hypothetical protein
MRAFNAFAGEPFMLKTDTGIVRMLSFEEGTVVFIVELVAVMALPCRVSIICIPGEFVFISYRSGSIAVLANGGRGGLVRVLVNNSRGGGRYGNGRYINGTMAKADASAYIYLGVAFRSDEGAG